MMLNILMLDKNR